MRAISHHQYLPHQCVKVYSGCTKECIFPSCILPGSTALPGLVKTTPSRPPALSPSTARSLGEENRVLSRLRKSVILQ